MRVTDQTIYLAKAGWPAKIGTVPQTVIVHQSDIRRIAPDNWIRVKMGARGSFSGCPWQRVLVRSVDPETLHFQADQ